MFAVLPSPALVLGMAATTRARAISGMKTGDMTKLKLSTVPDDRPVKIAIALPAAIHRDLALYAELLAKENGQAAVEPSKLVPRH